MRHIVEQIPMQPGLIDASSDMPSDQPKLSVSLNVNAGIDADMNLSLVGDQMAYWEAAAAKRRISVRRRNTVAELVAALNDPAASEQVIYFYCHAQAVRPDQPGGLDAASLTLDSSITLGDLKLDAPTKRMLPGAARVHQCLRIADLSPAFYDGFVPYFMSKGARGVIGTESVTPALFAQHWASAFFDAFLEGQSVGATFLALRRQFLRDHGNPLGLLYAVHCDGDVPSAGTCLTRRSVGVSFAALMFTRIVCVVSTARLPACSARGSWGRSRPQGWQGEPRQWRKRKLQDRQA